MSADRRRHHTALLLGAGLAALCAGRASAQPTAGEPPRVRLLVPDCLGVAGEDVRALVALELAPRLRVAAADGEEAEIVGSVTCGSERVRIEVEDPQRAAPLQLEIDLAAAPERARTRLLALSIAELIATSRLEHAPQPATAAATPATRVEQVPEPTALAWRLWTAPGLSRMGDPALTLFGVDLGASCALGPAALLGELQARWGAADTLAAEVAVQTYSASLALSPVLSLGAFDLNVGPGVRLGYARLAGEPAQPGLEGLAVAGPWFGPIAGAGVQLRLAPWGGLRAAFELGYVAKPVRGLDHEANRLLELRGVWTSASFGAVLLLPPHP